jgi:hypothetical protein
MRRGLAFTTLVPSLLIAVGSAWTTAQAQAWVGEHGSLEVGVDYNLGISDKIVGGGSQSYPNAGVQTQQCTFNAGYVPIPALAIDLSLPLIAIKNTGDKVLYAHPGGGRYDDGSYHATLTDLAATVRYQLVDSVVAFTPHLGFSIPVAGYETVGNAGAGRHLKALHLGAAVGKDFATTFYAQLSYDFALTEKYDRTPNTAAYGQNTSTLTFTVGDKLLDGKLDVNLAGSYHLNHDGITFDQFASGALPADVALYHDPVLKESVLLLGGGVGYQVADSVNVALAARLWVTGANTQNASVFGLAISWSPL